MGEHADRINDQSIEEVPTPDHHSAARTLQRRLQQKVWYRRRRDRKIGVEWLGRWFDLDRLIPFKRTDQDGKVEWVKVQIVGYDPNRALVEIFIPTDNTKTAWETDEFWAKLRNGTLVQS